MYPQIKNWKDNYTKDGMPDQRALEDFLACETEENVQSLRRELYGISQGNMNEVVLNSLLGAKRIARHETYPNWASLMIQWMAGIRR